MNTDRTNLTALPNLSAWHRVPVGATIPKDTPYLCTFGEDSFFWWFSPHGEPRDISVVDNAHYTERPILPPLPTEGSIMATSLLGAEPYILMHREGDHWRSRNGSRYEDHQITAWAPITIGETVVIR